MSQNVEKLLLQIKADLKDLKNLRAELKTVKQEAAETGKGIGDSLKSAVGGFAAGFSAFKIKGFLDSAVNEFNKLEKTMLGLQATARLTGANFDALKKQVTSLASDGVLSIDQASQSMKFLLAQGLSANKAFDLLDAAKKVGAFNNVVGDTGQAVADFVKFLQTGSAQLAENLDPSIIKVVKSLGGYAKVSTDAAAKQKLINAVIEKGSKLSNDYQKFLNSGAQAQVGFNSAATTLSQTLGQKLQPAYNALYNIGTALLNGLTSLIERLDSTTVSITAFSVVGFAGLASLAKGATLLGGTIGSIGTAIMGALGPIGLFLAAGTALVIAYNKLSYSLREDREALAKFGEAARKDVNEFNKLGKNIARLKEGTKEFMSTRDELIKQSEKMGIAIQGEVNTTEKLVNLYKKLKLAKQQSLEATITEQQAVESDLKRKYFELTGNSYLDPRKMTPRERIAWRNKEREAGLRPKSLTPEERRRAAELRVQLQEVGLSLENAKIAKFRLEKGYIESESGRGKDDSGFGSGTPTPEFRFIKIRDELIELNKEYDKYLARVAAEQKLFKKDKDGNITNYKEAIAAAKLTPKGLEAAEKLKLEEENRLSQLRQQYAEYIESRYDAEREKIEQAKNAAIEAAYEEYNTRVRLAGDDKGKISKAHKDLQDKLSGIEKQTAAKNAANVLQSFNDTLKAANEISSGILQIKQAEGFSGKAKGVGATLSATGGALSKSGLAIPGAIVQGAGQFIEQGVQLYDSIKSIFGKSDEERAREAEERKRQQEEANRLLEIQADYQKRMLAIQEANAKLPFENLQRRLRLVDINIQQRRLAGEAEDILTADRLAQRQSIISEVLTSQSGTIAGGELFKDVASDPTTLTKFLSERAAQAPYIKDFVAYANSALGDVGSIEELQQYYGYMQSLAGNVPAPLAQAGLQAVQAKIANFWRQYAFIQSDSVTGRTSKENRAAFMRDVLLAANYGVGPIAVDRDNKGFYYDTARVGDSGLSRINALFSEISSDTTVAENLLSVVEESLQNEIAIKEHTKKTAENTAKLTLLDDRRRSYLDLGNRRVFSQGFNVDFQNIKLPDSIGTAILATVPGPSLASDTVTELKKVVAGLDEANEWLAIIAANTDARNNTDTTGFDNYLINKLAQIRSRRIS